MFEKIKILFPGDFNLELGIMTDEWKNIHSLPYQCSMEVSTRIFQYKINTFIV